MFIYRLKVQHLRCYEFVEVEFNSKFNVISGLNGQGKTSLIESLGLLSTYKSFRGAKNSEILKSGAEEGRVLGKVQHEDLNFDLEVKIWENRKQAFFNGKKCKYLSEYVGKLHSVSFSPTDLEIVRGAPELRRNWIDKISQVYFPEHVNHVMEYGKILDQRNRLLKAQRENKNFQMTSELEIWTDQLCEAGAHIVQNRCAAIGLIHSFIEKNYELISKHKTSIILEYFRSDREVNYGQNNLVHDSLNSLEDIQNSLKKSLILNVTKDLVLGSTSVGPHRDDIEVKLEQLSAKAHGSQGEIRSLILAMRLAEVEEIKRTRGLNPLLLIDDFSSELDSNRRRFLLEYLIDSGSQIFLTTTEDISFGKKFLVNEGKVLEI